jgi:hypothetical protein
VPFHHRMRMIPVAEFGSDLLGSPLRVKKRITGRCSSLVIGREARLNIFCECSVRRVCGGGNRKTLLWTPHGYLFLAVLEESHKLDTLPIGGNCSNFWTTVSISREMSLVSDQNSERECEISRQIRDTQSVCPLMFTVNSARCQVN